MSQKLVTQIDFYRDHTVMETEDGEIFTAYNTFDDHRMELATFRDIFFNTEIGDIHIGEIEDEA